MLAVGVANSRRASLLPGACALAPPLESELLAYDTSGRRLGSDQRSVSYAALAFYHPTEPPPEPREAAPRLVRELSDAPRPQVDAPDPSAPPLQTPTQAGRDE